MHLKEITLLSFEDFQRYMNFIPNVERGWWLKTHNPSDLSRVYVVMPNQNIALAYCFSVSLGVRPYCTFMIEPADSEFWCKSDKLIGSKIQYGKYNWTILDIDTNEVYALCDSLMGPSFFDAQNGIWGGSYLKRWLDNEGLVLIQA